MRKPKDFDTELKSLQDRAKLLKERKVRQLGELVIASRADALDVDILAGALVHAATMRDAATKEGWRKAGAAMFRGNGDAKAGGRSAPDSSASAQAHGTQEPPPADAGAD